jgi:hypothetical protein
VSKDYVIQKAAISPIYLQPELLFTTKLLSPQEVVDKINQNDNAAIIVISQEEIIPHEITDIQSGTLKTVKLEYRFDNQLKLIYPFYRFSGDLTNNQNQLITADIISPAIAVDSQL